MLDFSSHHKFEARFCDDVRRKHILLSGPK
jgi:hypothetical protein